MPQGSHKAAEALKRTRYILMSSRETLQRKDREAVQGKLLSKGGSLFQKAEITRRPGRAEKYDQLIRENQLLFTLDLIKEMLSEAYKASSEPEMASRITPRSWKCVLPREISTCIGLAT